MHYRELQKQQMDELETHKCSSDFPASIVAPVEDYANDQRKYLTIVAHPTKKLISKITNEFVRDLKKADPSQYYCEPDSLHFTILSIKLFEDGGNFSPEIIAEIIKVTNAVFSSHHPFIFKMQGSLALPTSIGVRCYSSIKLRKLVCDLKSALNKIGITSDKKLYSENVLFGNITLCRFKPEYHPTDELFAVVEKYRNFEFGNMKLLKTKLVHANAVVSPNHTKVFVEFSLS